jgi:aminopeptidase YwaD
MKKIVFLFLFLPLVTFSQDIKYAHYVIDTLASPSMFGRGYAHKGNLLAAKFIASELEKNHIQKKGKSYFQDFKLNTNIFPARMSVIIDEKTYIPGVDYLVNANSCPAQGEYKIAILNSEIINNEKKYIKFKSKNLSEIFVLIDTIGLTNQDFKDNYFDIIDENTLNAKGIMTFSDKLTYVPGRYQNEFAHIIFLRSSFPEKYKMIDVMIDAQNLHQHKTQNVFGFIEGDVDTFIVFTAHYDHIGTMGKKTFFPGAHDNASGCAMVLDLAKEFSERKSRPHYSMAFIFFSGEELGLFGSKYFVDNPLIPLKKIKFLINLDMMGSGDEGVQIVNSTVFVREYELMLKINEKYNLLPQIKKRGPAANSDHYYFYEKGVPSYFIYSLGEYKEYHNINDSRENIPLAGYNSMFKLFMHFADELN